MVYQNTYVCGNKFISYDMNSLPRGDIDPYYDCKVGGAITPTVVSNFNLPNSNVNKDGPYLQIIEQPQTKFRFRYKSEMVGTHGQLKAESSDKNKNVYPTVKLCNWNEGPALIRLTLYTAEDNANDRKRHVHELNGKNCNKEGFTGGCEVVVDENNNYTAQFPNLGIIHIAKRDVQNIIFQRKKEELVSYACMKNPGLRTESIQHNISPTDLQKLKENGEEEAKNMDLNKVVLRFQTFFFNTKANCYRPITEYVDSDVIFNLKNASTGELKIVRISAVSSPCSGGAEVWMLVEKVKKNNVRIKFFELDNDNCEVWKGYGDFKESDVHHQYAIVFRTPPYRYTNLREPVHVKVQLERTTDNDTSEPLDFMYIPENLKRPSASLDTKMEMDINPQKRVRHNNAAEPMDLKTRGNLFLGSRELKQPYSPETPYQSPSHMVPSPITPADSPSSQGFYSPPHSGSTRNPSITISNTGDDLLYLATHQEDSIGLPLSHATHPHQHMGNIHHQMGSPQYHFVFGADGTPSNGYISTTIDAGQISPSFHRENYSNQPSLSPMHSAASPYQQVPSPGSTQGSFNSNQTSPFHLGNISPGHSLTSVFGDQNCNLVPAQPESALAQIQQFDAVQKQVIHSKNQIPQQYDFSDLVNSPNQLAQNEDMDLLDIISDSKFFAVPKEFGDIQADCAPSKEKKNMHKSPTKKETVPKDIDSLTDKFAAVSVDDKKKEEKAPLEVNKKDVVASKVDGEGTLTNKDLALRVAITAAECLQSYAATGDIGLLLATHRYLLAVQDHHGDNSLHTAIENKNKEAFKKILKASIDIFCVDLLTTQNYAGETPLHVAVRGNEIDMAKQLLATPGCNLNILDSQGNTALHLAATLPTHLCLAAILSHPADGHPFSKIINLYNYHGQTALHMAVGSGCLENVKLLLESDALVHLCERKQGANPLHLAAMFGHHSIAKYLIDHTSITVDAGMFDRNTALHIAAQAKDKQMCSILIEGKANPNVMNSVNKSKKVSDHETEEEKLEKEEENKEESSSDEENEGEFFTPMDYAGDDVEVLNILRGEIKGDPKNEIKDVTSKEKKIDSATSTEVNINSATSKVVTSCPNIMDSGIVVSSDDL